MINNDMGKYSFNINDAIGPYDLINQNHESATKIIDAEISASQLKVKLDSGITVLMPLDHVPTLLLATEEERQEMEVFDHSLHWETLDCDLSVEGLLAGAKEMPSLARKAFEKFFARQYGQIAT